MEWQTGLEMHFDLKLCENKKVATSSAAQQINLETILNSH